MNFKKYAIINMVGDKMRVGDFLKALRIDNSLSIDDFAAKYNTTNEVITSWENNEKLPDMTILKKICNDFNIDINTILSNEEEATYKAKKSEIKRHIYYIIVLSIFLILSTLVLIKQTKGHEDFDFKTITTNCDEFKISANLAYDKPTSSIYITKVNYCGGNDKKTYDTIRGILYESEENSILNNGTKRKNIKLDEYLKNIHLSVDNYHKNCKNYTDDSLYLEVEATSGSETTTYKISLNLAESCKS